MNRKRSYNVAIIGAGPAGIFASLALVEQGIDGVLLVDQGRDINQRNRHEGGDLNGLLCGWGGAGAYSDGKLTLSPEVGGFLGEIIPRATLHDVTQEADRIYIGFGAPQQAYGENLEMLGVLEKEARLAGMQLVRSPVRHLGTDNCHLVLERMRRHLDKKVTVMTETKADRIVVENGRATGLLLSNGDPVSAKAVISAPGRVGAEWVKKEARRLGLPSVPSPVDIGVRVEAPAAILERLTDAAYEAKLIYYSKSFDDRLRTFCMNPYGEVVSEGSDHIMIVNGHSYAAKKTENTNFAILVSSTFTEPFDDPIAYGKYVARLANVLGKGIIIQRLGDLLKGRRSTPERIAKCATRPTFPSATPGDLSFALPYRHLKGIMEMLEAMDKLTPGIFSRHTLLYGVEVKFYSHRLAVSEKLESRVANLFFVGDGAGITRGLLQASVSGLLAGREVAERIKRPGETPRLSEAPKQSPPGKRKRSAEPFITAQK